MSLKLIYDIEPLNVYSLKYEKCTNPNKIILVKKFLDKFSENNNINKINNFIKYNNDGEILYILLNMISFPLLIRWYYETNILKYYWSNELINNIINSNKKNLKIHYLNNEFHLIKMNLIKLNNQYNLNFNFTDKILKKRYQIIIDFIKEKLDDIIQLEQLNVNFGSDFVRLIGSNDFDSLINSEFSISLYFADDIKFKQKVKLNLNIPYYTIKKDNVLFKFYMYTYDFSQLISFREDALFNSDKEIYCNSYFYQNMDFNQNLTIKDNPIELYSIKLQSYKIKEDISTCYICKKYYNDSIYIENYENLCVECGIENFYNLNLRADLNGLTFLVTGGRVKIGYVTALKLLRNGASVIATTRYPNFAMSNYQSESDYDKWKEKLIIMECDFTKLKEIYSLLDILKEYKINGIINNACQTIKQSKDYYDTVNLIETELKANIIQNNSIQLYKSDRTILMNTIYNNSIQLYNTGKTIFKDIKDNLKESSWTQKIEEVTQEEIVEATLINQVVPTLLINKLKPNLIKPKFIINVTSLEGMFNHVKTDKHLHTNMCKAAMNMMIRTLNEDSDKDLYVYAINPGYVSGVLPQNHKYQVPLEDGASRITYPIIKHMNGETLGKEYLLMSNYKPTPW